MYRIPHGCIDALADGRGEALGIQRIVMTGYVNGLTVSPIDDSCWAVSCSSVDPANGAIYNLTDDAFKIEAMPEPVHRDLGVLDGVGVTRRGTVLASNPRTGQIFAFPSQRDPCLIDLGEHAVGAPADFNVVYPTALKGEPALLVPDISVGSPPGSGIVVVASIAGL